MASGKSVKKRSVGLVLALLILVGMRVIPLPAGLSREGLYSIGFWGAAICLWIFESTPFSISALLLIVMMPFYGIITLGEVWENFATSTFFFIFASFAITAAMATSNIPQRFATSLIHMAGSSSLTLLLGFMLGTAVISAVMSNVPATALFLTIALSLVQKQKELVDCGFAKCIMIGIPYAAVIGGFMTPVGTAVNLVAISLYEQATGNTIRFLDWMIVGIPVALLSLAICAVILQKTFCKTKNIPINISTHTEHDDVQLTARDYKILALIAIMFALWLSSTWVPQINNTIVAIIGMVVFFMPGVDILNMHQMEKETSLDVLMMVGDVQVLALGLTTTGAADWLADTCFSGVTALPKFVIYLLVALFACVLHLFVPLGSAVSGIVTIPVIHLGVTCGLSIPAAVLVSVFWSSVALVFPTDCTTMLAYKHGYFELGDISRCGLICTAVTLVSSVVLIVLMSGFVF